MNREVSLLPSEAHLNVAPGRLISRIQNDLHIKQLKNLTLVTICQVSGFLFDCSYPLHQPVSDIYWNPKARKASFDSQELLLKLSAAEIEALLIL